MTSDSVKFREQGNTFYKKAFSDGIAPALKKYRLENAMTLYTRSLTHATMDEERASAAKNYAKSAQIVAMLYQDHYKEELEKVIYYYKETFQYFNKAIEYGRHCKSDSWREDVLSTYRISYEKLVEVSADMSRQERVAILESAAVGMEEQHFYYNCMLQISEIWLKEAVTALSASDYKKSLYALKEMYKPIEIIKKGCRSGCNRETHSDIFEDALTHESDMVMQMARTESLQAIDVADSLLESHLKDAESINMDLVYDVIDSYRAAILLTREIEIEVEAIALSKLGKVYDQVLKEKYRASPCFKLCIELAHALTPRVMSTEPWFKLATETLKKYQAESAHYQDTKKEEERKECLQELKREMKILRDAQKKFEGKDGEFLLHVIQKLPPKRDLKLPKKSELKKASRKELKKLFLKAVACYHPDKQDIDVHGKKWRVLCQEITKSFTCLYERYKGV